MGIRKAGYCFRTEGQATRSSPASKQDCNLFSGGRGRDLRGCAARSNTLFVH
jgi:hypothetical protein